MNLSKWRQMRERLSRMERDERSFRMRQELHKRQDGLLSIAGFDFARRMQRSPHPGHGNFFFAPVEIDARVDLLRQRLPEQAKRIVEQADKILQHRFDLLGYSDLAYGSPIDWHLDLVHGKCAGRAAFYRVPYLEFAQVGDSKITWELNRHQHFVTLAKAYRLTGDARYPDEVLRQWRHWWAENRYPVGINWASSLEAGFRSLSWLWTYHLLAGARGVPDFREEWLRGLALHGRHIERYLSTYFSPNTHLLGEGVALFFLGVLCPELAAAERWKTTGWRIVLEESRRQVQADGFHFEQSTYYHVYALDFFLHAAILASANDVPVPGGFEAGLEKMLTALYLLGRAGTPPRFGDDDGGRVFDPRRNRSEHLLDPLATGAILFNRGDYKAAAGPLREETIWLLGPQGVKVWDELEATPRNMSSVALAASGYYLLASDKPSTQLAVDCGPLGAQSGGHGHADALSVTLQSNGRDLLIDPGTCEYVGDSGDRNLFRGTAMHNILRVDGLDQAEPATSFSWRRLTQATVEKWVQGKSFDLLVGSHDGYQRLSEPLKHRRWVLSLRDGLYLVRDCVDGQGKHQLEISWHLGPEMQMIEEGVFRIKGASQGLALLVMHGHGWAEEVRRQSWSPVYGQKASTTVATFSKTVSVPAEFSMLLVTLEEAQRSPGKFARIVGQEADLAVAGYRYVGETSEHLFFFGESGKPWRRDSVSSDAEVVCFSRESKGTARRLILVNGSYAEVLGGPHLRCKRTVAWGELSLVGDRREIFTSEPDVIDDEMALTVQAAPESNPS